MRPCAVKVDSPETFHSTAIGHILDVQRFIEFRLHKEGSEPHYAWF